MHSRQPTSLVISRHYCLISFHSLECGSSILTNRTAIHTKFDFVSLSVHCVKNFRESYVFHCLVIKVVCCLPDSLFILSQVFSFVNNFFYFSFFRREKEKPASFEASLSISLYILFVKHFFHFFSNLPEFCYFP